MSDLPINPYDPYSTRLWPRGPNYRLLPPGGDPAELRVNLKLIAARWYLDTLSSFDDCDRFVGVEMALDGFLSTASAAFDVAVGALITAIESRLPPGSPRIPVYQYKWKAAKELIRDHSIACKSEAAVGAALAGENDPIPTGWLAELRRLRNIGLHRDTLSRSFPRTTIEHLSSGTSGGSSSPTMLVLPDSRTVPIVDYLAQVLNACRDLVQDMLTDAASLRAL